MVFEEGSGVAWLLVGAWQLTGVRRNTDKGSCPLCLGEEEAKHILDCWETRNWKLEFLNHKWLNMNKEVACRNMLRFPNKDWMRNLGRYLDIVKCKWFNKTNCKYVSIK
jgi:hypothetical protein